MLGEAKKLNPTLGEKIPNEVAERWEKILVDGLAKEQKDTLKETILVAENFTMVRAPKLNPEVGSILSDSAKNRDRNLETAQNQLGIGIAGLANLTRDLIQSQSVDKIDVLKRVTQISQILLDLHYEESLNRRKLILPLLDKKFWTVIKGVKRDEYLFGDKLGESIKNSKDIEKSSLQIKKQTQNNTLGNRRTNFQTGNMRGPPQRANTSSMTPMHRNQPAQPTRRTYNSTTQRSRRVVNNKMPEKKTRH